MDLNRQLYKSNAIAGDYLHNTISIFLDEMADLVMTTYGPFGSHGLIHGDIKSEPTKDGLTLLSSIQVDKSIAKSVHDSIMSVAKKQVEEVGDGSTSTVLLLREIYHSLMKLQKEDNLPPSILKQEMSKVIELLIEELKNSAIKIDRNTDEGRRLLYDSIYTSLDGDSKLADILCEMFDKLKSDEPMIMIETSPTNEHRYELIKGVELDGTIIRPDVFFMGYSRKSYDNPYIIVVNGRMDLNLEMFMSLSENTRRNGFDVIFLCTGINDNLLDNMVNMNQINPGLFSRMACFQMRKTAHNEEFLDLCASIGAHPVDSETLARINTVEELNNVLHNSHGMATKVLLTEFCARFSEPKADKEQVQLRLEDINAKIKLLEDDPAALNMTKHELRERKAFLSTNYAKFYVGGMSYQRKSINYQLVADAVPQAISAMKHGVVEGCNVTIPKIIDDIINSPKYEEYRRVMTRLDILKMIKDSYEKLFKYIVYNKVMDMKHASEMVDAHIRRFGLVPMNIRDYSNKYKVYNSADTDRAILENATDMAVLLATTKSFISKHPEFDIVNKY